MGEKDPNKMIREMPIDQWMGWKLYSEMEPWGFPIEDAQATYSRLIAAQAGGVKNEHNRPLKWDDLSLRVELMNKQGFKARKPKMSQEGIMNTLKAFFGSRSKRKRK